MPLGSPCLLLLRGCRSLLSLHSWLLSGQQLIIFQAAFTEGLQDLGSFNGCHLIVIEPHLVGLFNACQRAVIKPVEWLGW